VCVPHAALYDSVGGGYTVTRGTDPKIAQVIWAGLGDARSVLNVGAGAGAYEPPDREVLAVEPSSVMIAHRPANAAPVVRAVAEALPVGDDRVDAVMAVLSDHLWVDRRQGLRELRRVARRRVVLFNADPTQAGRFWLTREYLPGVLSLIPRRFHQPGVWVQDYLTRELGPVRLLPVPIPHDCRDGFYGAFWRRPAAYLRPEVRAGISLFARLSQRDVTQALDKLRQDLASGVWQARHAKLVEQQELDLGYYLIIVELA
jgi:SAM-dependent methyltransferase